MARAKLSAKIRRAVYAKYGGRCAYCGIKIGLGQMQVDHIKPVYVAELHEGQADNSMDNLLPACRDCNFYKSTFSLEDFRARLATVYKRIPGSLQARLSYKYGMITTPSRIEFYFEKVSEGKNE